jgi:hypothetical protein
MGRDLGDHVDAVLVLVDHAGHAADLALDAAQARLQLLLLHGVAGHGASSVSFLGWESGRLRHPAYSGLRRIL